MDKQIGVSNVRIPTVDSDNTYEIIVISDDDSDVEDKEPEHMIGRRLRSHPIKYTLKDAMLLLNKMEKKIFERKKLKMNISTNPRIPYKFNNKTCFSIWKSLKYRALKVNKLNQCSDESWLSCFQKTIYVMKIKGSKLPKINPLLKDDALQEENGENNGENKTSNENSAPEDNAIMISDDESNEKENIPMQLEEGSMEKDKKFWYTQKEAMVLLNEMHKRSFRLLGVRNLNAWRILTENISQTYPKKRMSMQQWKRMWHSLQNRFVRVCREGKRGGLTWSNCFSMVDKVMKSLGLSRPNVKSISALSDVTQTMKSENKVLSMSKVENKLFDNFHKMEKMPCPSTIEFTFNVTFSHIDNGALQIHGQFVI